MDSTVDSEKVFLTINNWSSESSDEKNKIAKKQHCQFGHSRLEKLKKLLQYSNIHDKEAIEEINNTEEQCDICLKYKKPKSRPVVAFSIPSDISHVVAVDLKTMEKVHILHIVDHATWFIAAAAVKSKEKEEIAEAFIKNWIAIFGTPKTILSDNGAEFNNELPCELCEQFNLSIKSTAAQAAWPNGIVERHNALLGKMINKLLIDNYSQYPIDVIFSWAASAKNTLHTCYGFSPNQIVFGRNPNLLFNLINLPPEMEDGSKADIIVNYLNAFDAARKAFIEAESNEKLRRTLKAKNWVTTGITYEIGDIVYYKRKDSN